MHGRHFKAVHPHVVIMAQYLILVVFGEAWKLLSHSSSIGGGRGRSLVKNGEHKSPPWCGLRDLKLYIWGETCLTLRTSLCRPVGFMMRISLSGGTKCQSWVINDGQGSWNKMKVQTENVIRYRALSFIVMEFDCEPSGHRRTSQYMKVHNDSEMSAEAVQSLGRLFILSGLFLTRGHQPSLHSPSSVKELLYLFLLTTWSCSDAERWIMSRGFEVQSLQEDILKRFLSVHPSRSISQINSRCSQIHDFFADLMQPAWIPVSSWLLRN